MLTKTFRKKNNVIVVSYDGERLRYHIGKAKSKAEIEWNQIKSVAADEKIAKWTFAMLEKL